MHVGWDERNKGKVRVFNEFPANIAVLAVLDRFRFVGRTKICWLNFGSKLPRISIQEVTEHALFGNSRLQFPVAKFTIAGVQFAHKKAPGEYEVLGGRRTDALKFREPVVCWFELKTIHKSDSPNPVQTLMLSPNQAFASVLWPVELHIKPVGVIWLHPAADSQLTRCATLVI